jgi:hypothetical protein
VSYLRYTLVIVVVALITKDAHAYLDPGTGSMLLQVAIAGMIGAAVFLRAFWSRIVSFFKSKDSDTDE